jgi:tripartite-type tricarboxylate transporter receptor subunit TctC
MKPLAALATLIACALAPLGAALGQGAYPARPVKIVCGFAAGSSLDVVTRIYAEKLEESLGQPFVVENRTGASGNLAAQTVAAAAGDGYTLLSGGISQAISMSLFKNAGFNIVSGFTPIGSLGSTPSILAVNAALGVRSVPELIARAKAHPNELTYGTAGIGTGPHMTGELFSLMSGIKLVHVPYRGTNQGMIDLIGGRLSLMFAPAPTIAPHMTDSRLILLATTSAARSSLAPDLPPLADTPGLAGFETSLWYALWAPKGTAKKTVQVLNDVLIKTSANPDVRRKLDATGTDPVNMTPDELGTFVHADVEKWAKVVAFSGAKID